MATFEVIEKKAPEPLVYAQNLEVGQAMSFESGSIIYRLDHDSFLYENQSTVSPPRIVSVGLGSVSSLVGGTPLAPGTKLCITTTK